MAKFERSPRGLAGDSVSENHVDRSYCLKSFCHLKTLEKCVVKFFLYYKSMQDSYVLKKPVPEKRLTAS